MENTKYNAEAVDKAIAASTRAGHKIGAKERKLIHRLLQDRSISPVKKNPKRRKPRRVSAKRRVSGITIKRNPVRNAPRRLYVVWARGGGMKFYYTGASLKTDGTFAARYKSETAAKSVLAKVKSQFPATVKSCGVEPY